MLWSTLTALFVAQAAPAPALPSYEVLSKRAGEGLHLPNTCATYQGHVYQLTRIPMVANEATAYNFVGILDHGVWQIPTWTALHGEKNSQVDVEGTGLPFLPPSYGKMKVAPGETSSTVSISVGEPGRSQADSGHPPPVGQENQPDPASKKSASPQKSTPPPNNSLSFVEKATLKVALHQAMKEVEPELREAGVDPDLVQAALMAVIEQGGDTQLSEDQVETVIRTALAKELGVRGKEEVESLTRVVLLAMRGELDKLDTPDAPKVAPPPELAPMPTIQRVEEPSRTPPEASPPSAPGGNLEIHDIFQAALMLLELPDEQVEMRSVEVTHLNGRQVYVLRRVVDLENPWFGDPRINALTIWFDPFSLDPLRWQVDIQLPTRLTSLSIPGRIKRFNLLIDLDALGRITDEQLGVAYNLGPLGLEIERKIQYTWQGSCGG